MGLLSKIWEPILPGGLQGAIPAILEGVTELASKAVSVTESVVAGVGSLGGRAAEALSFGGNDRSSEPEVTQKLGLNARKQEMAQAIDNSGFGCDHNSIQAPSFGVGAAVQSSGYCR